MQQQAGDQGRDGWGEADAERAEGETDDADAREGEVFFDLGHASQEVARDGGEDDQEQGDREGGFERDEEVGLRDGPVVSRRDVLD